MTIKDEDFKTLIERNARLSEQLAKTTDILQKERADAAKTKNKVPGGYYMMSRKAERNLRDLQRKSPTASLVFSVIRETMKIGTNAVTISNPALAAILGKSSRTVARAIKYLSENNYVQIVKVGNTNTYIVNEQIAFAGNVGQRMAVFSATVVAHEVEQDEGWDQVNELKNVPVIYHDETVIYPDERLPEPTE